MIKSRCWEWLGQNKVKWDCFIGYVSCSRPGLRGDKWVWVEKFCVKENSSLFVESADQILAKAQSSYGAQEWETSLSWALIVRLRQDLSNRGKGMNTEVMVIQWAGLDLRGGYGKFGNQVEQLGAMQKHFLNFIIIKKNR